MMIKIVDPSFGGGSKGEKHGFRGYFEVQATFLTASTHQSHQTFRKGVFGSFTTSQIASQNIDRKVSFVK